MKLIPRRLMVWVWLGAISTAAGPLHAQNPQVTFGVYRYVAATKGFAGPLHVLQVQVVPLDGKKPQTFTVLNQTPTDTNYDPDPGMVSQIKKLRKGDAVRIGWRTLHGRTQIETISFNAIMALDRYDLVPGETEPGVYRFVGAVKPEKPDQASIAALFLKTGEQKRIDLANSEETPKGNKMPDQELVRKLKALEKDDLVRVTFETDGSGYATLTGVELYFHPITGRYMSPVDENGRPTRLPKPHAIQIRDGKETITVELPAEPSDELLTAIKEMRRGTPVVVEYERVGEDKKQVLTKLSKSN